MTIPGLLIVISCFLPLWQVFREKPMAHAWALAYAIAVLAFLVSPAAQLPVFLRAGS